jgi:hypothetical protein
MVAIHTGLERRRVRLKKPDRELFVLWLGLTSFCMRTFGGVCRSDRGEHQQEMEVNMYKKVLVPLDGSELAEACRV